MQYAWLHACSSVYMRSWIFWDIKQGWSLFTVASGSTRLQGLGKPRRILLDLHDYWRWDRQVVQKYPWLSSNRRCGTSQKGEDLSWPSICRKGRQIYLDRQILDWDSNPEPRQFKSQHHHWSHGARYSPLYPIICHVTDWFNEQSVLQPAPTSQNNTNTATSTGLWSSVSLLAYLNSLQIMMRPASPWRAISFLTATQN